jgi:predicted nucleotidyltransferase component of viral defense system
MFAADNPFLPQARLAARVLRIVAEEPNLALKGGTAINFFYRDLPRLSVDLDLTYLPVEEREASLAAIKAALHRIAGRVEATSRDVRVHAQGAALGKLVAQQGRMTVTIEVNPVLRGTVYPAERRRAQPAVGDLLGDIEAHVVSLEDVCGGKMVAALDRQHPRDLFDIMMIIDDGMMMTPRLFDALVVYLASHDRPMAEVLKPREKNLEEVYDREFAAMASNPVTLDQLVDARRRLIAAVRAGLNERQREFLRSVKRLKPDWSLIDVPHARELPGLRWRLFNLEKLRREQPAKYSDACANLDRVLDSMG